MAYALMPPGNWTCVRYGDRTGDKPRICPKIGEPIYPLTGVERMDVDLGLSIGGIPLAVTYDTRTALPEESGGATWLVPPPASFGTLWESNLHRSLVLQSPTGQPNTDYSAVALQSGGGVHETFAPAGQLDTCGDTHAGTDYVSSVEPLHHVGFSGLASRFIDQKSLDEQDFDASGHLVKLSKAGGGSLGFAYSSGAGASAPTDGLLLTVTDSFGRNLQFTYEQPATPSLFPEGTVPPPGGYPPRITTITGPGGQVVHAAYDPISGNLTGLTWPDSTSRQFVYENHGLPWAMTGIVDENNARYSTVGYDAQGRASSSELAGGVDRYTVAYDPDPMVVVHWRVFETFIPSVPVMCRIHTWVTPDEQLITTPSSQSVTLSSASILGMPNLTGQTQPAGSGCLASTNAQVYDASGNVTRYDDFNGNRRCSAYDLTRNAEVVRVDGLPTSKSCPADLSTYVPSAVDGAHPERKTSTQWHPDWALEVREAEPGKITTWVYNGQADPIGGGTASCAAGAPALPDGKPIAVLCKRYEQSTDDPDGGRNFTPATITGTRAWSFTYDPFGQVLMEVAPKQVSTDPDSKTTTTYVYYADTSFPDDVSGHTTGDLQSARNPLGQVTQYTSYDKAGRLLSSTAVNGTVTTRIYSARGWLHTMAVAPAVGAPQTTTFDYWPTGLLHVATLPDNTTLTYLYDDAHRLTDVTDGAGNTVHYTLDNEGNRTGEQLKDASGKLAATVTRVFDALDRVQSVTGAMH